MGFSRLSSAGIADGKRTGSIYSDGLEKPIQTCPPTIRLRIIIGEMKTARVRIDNRIHQVSVNDDYSVISADGRTWQEDDVTWLPPEHGTVFALGLNYVDHAAELSFKAPEEPLAVFENAKHLCRTQAMQLSA